MFWSFSLRTTGLCRVTPVLVCIVPVSQYNRFHNCSNQNTNKTTTIMHAGFEKSGHWSKSVEGKSFSPRRVYFYFYLNVVCDSFSFNSFQIAWSVWPVAAVIPSPHPIPLYLPFFRLLIVSMIQCWAPSISWAVNAAFTEHSCNDTHRNRRNAYEGGGKQIE